MQFFEGSANLLGSVREVSHSNAGAPRSDTLPLRVKQVTGPQHGGYGSPALPDRDRYGPKNVSGGPLANSTGRPIYLVLAGDGHTYARWMEKT